MGNEAVGLRRMLVLTLVIGVVAYSLDSVSASGAEGGDCALSDCSLSAPESGVSPQPGAASEGVLKAQKAAPASALSAMKKSGERKKMQSGARAAEADQETPTSELGSNLPGYYRRLPREGFQGGRISFEVPQKMAGARLSGMHPGDRFLAHIDDAHLVVSSTVPAPVSARVVGDRFRGGVFVGQAVFDPSIRGRVLLEFSQIQLPNSELSYQLKAQGKDLSGELGLLGDLHTNAAVYAGLAGLAAAIAGYSDATIDRDKTALGGTIAENTVTNNLKQGATSGALEYAKLSADQARSSPEYTTIDGDRNVLVVVTSNPTEN